jgi:hypothetical protein
MFKRFLSLLALSTLLFTATAVTSVGAATADVFQNIDCTQARDSAVCQEKDTTKNPLTGTHGIIMNIANIVSVIAGVAAVIIIIVSGLKFITGGSDPNEVAAARRSIIYALLGLIVIVSARLIIGLIVGNL